MNQQSALASIDRLCGADKLPFAQPALTPPVSLADIAAQVHTVNPDTGLSTDFLNQYNELSMLLDLAADDPDMLEELEDWSARSYEEHFAASGFRDWALVVAAYEMCPPAIRTEFDSAITVLNSVATAGVKALLAAVSAGDTVEPGTIHALAAEVQGAIVHASGLINGSNTLGSQAQVDTLFARAQAEYRAPSATSGKPEQTESAPSNSATATADAPAAADDELLDQDAIDALFD